MRTWDQSKFTSYCICVWCESGELRGRGSSRFPCNSSGGNLLRKSFQTLTTELLCVNRQRPKQVDCFRKKNSTTDLPWDFKCRSDQRCCVWVECTCMEFVAVSWCRRKWFRLYQTIRNLTSGDMRIPLVVIQLGIPD